MPRGEAAPACLVHLASGVGNIVLATPLLVALSELGYEIDVCLHADYAQTADLLQPWSLLRRITTEPIAAAARHAAYDAVVPAVPPFYWRKYAREYGHVRGAVPRPPDARFYEDEQGYYLALAEPLGYRDGRRPSCTLPIGPRDGEDRVGLSTVVIAAGCKTGVMAAKRWPHFPALADRLDDVAVVGTSDDLRHHDGTPMVFPAHVRSFVDALSLRETAELLAAAGVVVANDSGLAHVAAAVGTPTVMLFGPTSDAWLGRLPACATVLKADLPCEPCWRTAPLKACGGRVACLASLDVARVEATAQALLGR
jgi:ADP-heptose:LPS heptosyltransferase